MNRKREIEQLIKKANVEELVKIVNDLDEVGRGVVLQAINSELTDIKKKKFIEEVKRTAVDADGKIKVWLVTGMSETYVEGMKSADSLIKKFGIKLLGQKLTVELLKEVEDLSPHLASVNSLLSDAYLDFGNAMTGYVRGAEHILNDALKQQVRQKIALGRLDGKGIKEIKKIVSQTLGDKGFNVLLDRGGKQWSLNNYSQMLARTHIIKANNEATINRALDYDIDIMEVSDHNTETPLCQEFEGKIYSISGKSENYPKMEATPPYHPQCLSKDTEIYTKKGWREVGKVKVGELVLSLNPDNFDLEYLPVKKRHSRFDEKMVSFKSNNLDILVTKDHQMLYQTAWDSKNNKNRFKFINSEKLIGKKSGRFFASSNWVGSEKVSKEMIKYARFMGIYLSEGSVYKPKNKDNGAKCYNTFVVSIAQSKKINPDKWELMKEVIEQFTNKHVVIGNQQLRFYDKKLGKYLEQFGKSSEKYVPDKIKKASPLVISEFLRFFALGDGSVKLGRKFKSGNFRDEISYSTSSKKMADDIGELIMKTGYRPSYYFSKVKGKKVKFRNGTYKINNNQWCIRQCYSKYHTLQSIKTKEVYYNNFSYCVELGKYHTILIRRKGKVVWVGNCKHSLLPRPDLS